jgi:hypothetical protein
LQAETHKNRGHFAQDSKKLKTLYPLPREEYSQLGSKVLLIPVTGIE